MTLTDTDSIALALRKVKSGYGTNWDANLFRAHADCAKAIARAIKKEHSGFDTKQFLIESGVDDVRISP
jgi:hypothetical protein